MTLVACKECGRQISDAAKACPQCGASNLQQFDGNVSAILTFLFGFVYFLVKGWYKASLAYLVVTVLSGGIAWLVVPFMAKAFVAKFEGS